MKGAEKRLSAAIAKRVTNEVCLTEIFCKIVLQQSIPAQIRQLIICAAIAKRVTNEVNRWCHPVER